MDRGGKGGGSKMIFESFIGCLIVIVVILMALSVCYWAGWKDGMRNEKEKIKKEIKGV